MKQTRFERTLASTCSTLEGELELMARGVEVDRPLLFAARLRALTQAVALARHRRYNHGLIAQLNSLAVRTRDELYRVKLRRLAPERATRVLAEDFPAAVRAHWRWLLLSSLLLVFPYLAALLGVRLDQGLGMEMLGQAAMENMERMYDPANPERDQRSFGTNIAMFGFYIFNNIGIAFRTFGAGALAGVGAAFVLVYNGMVMGAVHGHILNLGFEQTFHPFVIGHCAFELTAIVFAGMCGLKMGWRLLAPGAYGRKDALRLAAKQTSPIIWGAFAMLVAAAGVEAFWSPLPTPPALRYLVGAVLWLLVLLFFVFAGRRRAA